jgi:LmbE family N-acetylglucosaminyl deacetylase
MVAAHPDDIEFGAAGTVAGWTDAGVDVTYLLCTYGDQGGFDETPRADVPAIREAEQRDAAAVAGVTDVRFLAGFRDGYLEATHELVRAITRVIRQVRPVRVVAPSPERWWERIAASHPDHLAAGEAAVRAVYPASRNAFAYPELAGGEGLQPWTVIELWLMAHHSPDHYVDVTETFDRKLKAVRCHVSQTAHAGPEFEEMLREGFGSAAREADLGEDRYAESFKVVPTA